MPCMSFMWFSILTAIIFHETFAWIQTSKSACRRERATRLVERYGFIRRASSSRRALSFDKNIDSIKKQERKNNTPISPTVWIQEQLVNTDDGSQEWVKLQTVVSNKSASPEIIHNVEKAVNATMRWCTNFVEPLKLCPWTAGSISTPDAIAIHVAADESTMENAVRVASQQLLHRVQQGNVSAKVAIAFVTVLEGWDSFGDFYNWFVELEDAFLDKAEENVNALGNHVTIAPFHPDWEFQGQDKALAFEKKSPYPTISIVCTSEIDKAGVEATAKIGVHNENVLTAMGASALDRFYQEHVLSDSNKDTNIDDTLS